MLWRSPQASQKVQDVGTGPFRPFSAGDAGVRACEIDIDASPAGSLTIAANLASAAVIAGHRCRSLLFRCACRRFWVLHDDWSFPYMSEGKQNG